MDAGKELRDLVNEVEAAKVDLAKANGQIENIIKNLKEEAGTDSPAKAQKLVDKWRKESDEATKKLEGIITKLKAEYGW